MKCVITEIEKVERDNAVPYFVIKAKGQTGDATASVLDANGFVNPLACMSRVYNFTKTLFPATNEQAEALETQVVEGTNIMLDFIRMAAPCSFRIVRNKDADAIDERYYCEEKLVEKTNTTGKPLRINGQTIPPNGTYSQTEYVPRTFTEVTLTVFTGIVDGKEVCVEGDENQLLQRAWERGVTNDIYEQVDQPYMTRQGGFCHFVCQLIEIKHTYSNF